MKDKCTYLITSWTFQFYQQTIYLAKKTSLTSILSTSIHKCQNFSFTFCDCILVGDRTTHRR